MTPPTPLPPAIILVDDEPDVRIILQRLLTYFAEGYELVAVDTGAAALTALAAYQVPLLITDYNMSGMNGLVLARTVKAQSPGTKVMVTSAYATPELARDAKAAGADYYLPKPFPFDQLEAIVKAALTEYQVRSTAS
jgi:two-component system, NtrC family, nitrogen regulation response regulator NtrX